MSVFVKLCNPPSLPTQAYQHSVALALFECSRQRDASLQAPVCRLSSSHVSTAAHQTSERKRTPQQRGIAARLAWMPNARAVLVVACVLQDTRMETTKLQAAAQGKEGGETGGGAGPEDSVCV